MKNSTLAFLCLLIVLKGFSQTTTINYQTWNYPNPPCNVFGTLVNVPATVNGTSGSLGHLTNVGQPQFNNSAKQVELSCAISSSGVYTGTQYQINHNFQAGFSYAVTINAAISSTSVPPTSLVINLTNGANGGNTVCTGAGSISSSTSGNLMQSRTITSTVPSNYSYSVIPPQTQSFSSLTIKAVTSQNPGYSAIIYVKNITIVATPATPTFTLTPSPNLDVPLGSTNAQTFTVNNVYNSPGTLSYQWNLGSATNGWIYQGNPAPQTITVSSGNTLSLTPTNCGTLGNISVTPVLNGISYPNLTCTINRPIPPASSFNISGPDEFCNTASYSIGGSSTCGASVTWSLGTLNNHPNTASLSCTNCPTTTLTRINDGTVWLIATITYPNSTTYTIEKFIGAGAPTFRGWYNSPTNPVQPMNPSSRFEFNWNDACITTMITTSTDITSNSTVVWSDAGNSGGVTWYQNGNNLNFYFSDLNQYAYFRVNITNSCGTKSLLYRFRSVSDNCSGGMLRVMLAPNPTSNTVSVSLTDKKDEKNKKEITEIRILDKSGNIKQKWSYAKTGISNAKQIQLDNLPADIYTIVVFDGKNWTAEKIIKQ
jgi:hypothetical protein